MVTLNKPTIGDRDWGGNVNTNWQNLMDEVIDKTTFNANTILKADAADTPAALTVPEQTLVGRITSGVIAALTGTQVTALLNAFTSALKGLAPASGGGTTNFLRADGTWAAPGGGGGGGYELIEGKYQASGTSLTITVPANTLTVDGQNLYVEALYESTAIDQEPQLSWDGTALQWNNNLKVQSGQRAMADARIYRTAAAAQTIYNSRNDTGGRTRAGTSTDAATLSGTVDIVAYWETPGTNKVISLKVWKVAL